MKRNIYKIDGQQLVQTNDLNELLAHEIAVTKTSNGNIELIERDDTGAIKKRTAESNNNWNFYFATLSENTSGNHYFRYQSNTSHDSFYENLIRFGSSKVVVSLYLDGSTPAFSWGPISSYNSIEEIESLNYNRTSFIFYNTTTNKYYYSPIGEYHTVDSEDDEVHTYEYDSNDSPIPLKLYFNDFNENPINFVGMLYLGKFYDKSVLGF